jgi:hypothetical protein
MADLYLTPAERYTAALGGFYYGDLPEPGTVYTQLIKDILNGATPDKEPKNILARFIYSLYISDLGDPYPRYELAKLLYWKLHDITPTKSGSILTVTIDGEEDYMTINTDLSRLWYKVLFGSKTDVITEFPYIFNTMQNKLSDWELFGNEEHTGTPTFDNPIMPEGTGERTGNLFDKTFASGYNISSNGNPTAYQGDSRCATLEPIDVSNVNNVTFSFVNTASGVKNFIYSLFNGSSLVTRVAGGKSGDTIDVSQGNKLYLCVYSNLVSVNAAETTTKIMLNSGSTALPYEPYGIKIQISSAGQTTPIYLGEVETTRKVRKYECTGEEHWQFYSDSVGTYGAWQFYANNIVNGLASSSAQSNIADYGVTATTRHTNPYGAYLVTNGMGLAFQMGGAKDTFTNVTAWKSYLAQQYAAGTPITVWYVLATEETAVVNEPLMKIGDYADSLSRAKTGIDIPTIIGQNTLDVLTTVKPSSMRIEYTSADETKSRSKRISLLKSPLKKGLIK